MDAVMRGRPPLLLFTTLARDKRLFFKFFAGGLLDRGHLTLRHREIVIARTTARCGAEYEWGVHIRGFAGAANLTNAQIGSLVHGDGADDCWNDEEAVLLRTADALDARATLAFRYGPRTRCVWTTATRHGHLRRFGRWAE
ncbi:carboxymuconolactone decarboxylase family protein [Nocardia rhizosphaerae]|uniref:Carboxymuconolactone decarboxylase family protein n=1 Tax=Nocardia rhizosphaerae TaxID=1691571 RepID=A0ABV8KZ61_9NOCA